MKTGIDLLDKIEITTRRYYRAKAQAKNADQNIAISISCAPSETGLHSGSPTSRVELGAILQAEAEEKAAILHEELKLLRDQLKPYLFQLPAGDEKTALRMYYLRGQGFATIANKLTAKTRTAWTADGVINALQRGALGLKRII